MTMILSAHLGDCLLIASDNRSMVCDVETGELSLFNDTEKKVQKWGLGAIASTGETVFINRMTDYFLNLQAEERNVMDMIYDEIEKRLLEGVPKEMLINNTLIFSMFDGKQSYLYSIPTEPFFQEFDRGDGIKIIRPEMRTIHPWTVDVTCFNLPPDMSSLQTFQRNLKSMSDFDDTLMFVNYYIEELKRVFAVQASIDPSITTSFDLYFQNCQTGQSLMLHIKNAMLPSPILKTLNYWDKHNKTKR